MKVLIFGLVLCVCIGGCAAVPTVAEIERLSTDTQEMFVEAINALNAENERLNAEIDAVTLVKPETIDAIESLKDKDPTWWIALASLLLGGSGVNLWKNKKAR